MRLVLMTNSQKTSVPRLDYKAFRRSQARPFQKGESQTCRTHYRSVVGTGVGRVGGDRLGRPEEFLAAPPRRQPAVGSWGVGHTPEAVERWAANLQQRFGGRPIAVILEQSRGALVYCSPSTRTWYCSQSTPPPRRATARPSLRRVPRATPATRTLCWICCCASRTVASPAAGHRGNPTFAFSGRGAPANRRRKDAPKPSADPLSETIFSQVLQWFDDVASPWWEICWNDGPLWSNCSGRIPARCGSSCRSTTAGVRRRMSNGSPPSNTRSQPRKTKRCWKRVY